MLSRTPMSWLIAVAVCSLVVNAAVTPRDTLARPGARTDHAELAAIAERTARTEQELRGDAYTQLLGKVAGPMAALLAADDHSLVGVLPSGRPIFYATDNLAAAITVGTDAVWPGGWTA